jgi:iron complex outermembrane receptor protein
VDLDSSGEVVFNVDYTYTSELFNDSENTPELRREAINMLNAQVTYRAENGKWELAVGGENLVDERYIVSGQANRAGGNISGFFSPPRQWFATVRMKY